VDFTQLKWFVGTDGRVFVPRQHTVMAMMAYGFGDRVIADYMGCSVKAVQDVIGRIREANGWNREAIKRYYRSQLNM